MAIYGGFYFTWVIHILQMIIRQYQHHEKYPSWVITICHNIPSWKNNILLYGILYIYDFDTVYHNILDNMISSWHSHVSCWNHLTLPHHHRAVPCLLLLSGTTIVVRRVLVEERRAHDPHLAPKRWRMGWWEFFFVEVFCFFLFDFWIFLGAYHVF